VKNFQLHHFSDASEVAYGSVSYLRTIYADSEIHCAIVYSKSRVAPIKTMTIPRKELAAAAVSVQVDKTLRRELDYQIEDSYFWTDSMVVLC